MVKQKDKEKGKNMKKRETVKQAIKRLQGEYPDAQIDVLHNYEKITDYAYMRADDIRIFHGVFTGDVRLIIIDAGY